jgi:AsmA protein
MMALTGQGELNLLKEECDMRFNVRVLGGWKGESKLIDSSNRPRSRCVSTEWQALSYSLQVDQILRKQLQDEAKQRLNDWIERNKNSQDGKDVKKLLEKH